MTAMIRGSGSTGRAAIWRSPAAANQESTWEELCYNAQQAAEKAVKAVFVHLGERFPYVHGIEELLDLLESKGIQFPDPVRRSGKLTDFAFEGRYPIRAVVTRAEYEESLAAASAAVEWAEGIVGYQG